MEVRERLKKCHASRREKCGVMEKSSGWSSASSAGNEHNVLVLIW